MAKPLTTKPVERKRLTVKKRTSIGNSLRTKPTHKSKRRSWKRYRGQGHA